MGNVDFNHRRLKSKPTPLIYNGAATSEGNTIQGVVMAQVGEAKGHGFFLDQNFINDLVAYDELNFAGIGLKARFDHPALCDGTMGSQLGKFINFRVEGDKAVADLTLLEAANDSPTHPKMKDYIMKMAAESPDFLMSSIVFAPEAYFQLDAEGKKFELAKRNAKKQMMDINDPNPEFGDIYTELGDHFYTDIVEAGAATDALLSTELNADKLGVRVVAFLNDNDEIKDIIQRDPSVVTDFLEKIGVQVTLKADHDAAQAELANAATANAALTAQLATANAALETANATVVQLQKELSEEKEKPAASHLSGRTDTEGGVPINKDYAALGEWMRSKKG